MILRRWVLKVDVGAVWLKVDEMVVESLSGGLICPKK